MSLKTKLPAVITSPTEAVAFLTELYNNDEAYHPEDNALDVEWESADPSIAERAQLNKLMNDIYSLEGNIDAQNMICDPCLILLELDPNYHMEDETE